MKYLIVYNSRTGHTKEYAELLQKDLNCDITSLKDINNYNFDDFDYIIFGASLKMGKMIGLENFNKLVKDYSKIIYLTVGGGQLKDKGYYEKLKSENFTEDILSKAQFFYLPGGMSFEKYNPILRIMMKSIAKKANRPTTSYSYVSEEELNDVEEYINKLN